MDENITVVLQVQVERNKLATSTEERLTERFGRFYNDLTGELQYPCSCDSHAFDVFNDEFEDERFGMPFSSAEIIELPYPVEQFTPFTEESAGTVLAEYFAPARGWNVYDATSLDEMQD